MQNKQVHNHAWGLQCSSLSNRTNRQKIIKDIKDLATFFNQGDLVDIYRSILLKNSRIHNLLKNYIWDIHQDKSYPMKKFLSFKSFQKFQRTEMFSDHKRFD